MHDRLPARLYDDGGLPPGAGTHPRGRGAGQERPTVLVVDDREAIREVLSLVLQDAGYQVREAPDGAPALRQLRASREPMVVLLDMQMPGMDGVHLMRTVAGDTALAARHAYVLVTADATALPLAFATLLSRLNVPVVPKPFDIDDLLETVAQAAARLAAHGAPPSAGDTA